jgi:hypothetical protein
LPRVRAAECWPGKVDREREWERDGLAMPLPDRRQAGLQNRRSQVRALSPLSTLPERRAQAPAQTVGRPFTAKASAGTPSTAATRRADRGRTGNPRSRRLTVAGATRARKAT